MKKQESFEDSIRKLDEIVKKMEKGDAPLDEMLKMFEDGMALSRHCQQILDNAQNKVSIILKSEDGQTEKQNFEAE